MVSQPKRLLQGDRQLELRFTVPGEPRGKGRPRFHIRGGRPGTHTDDRTVNYESLVRLAAHKAGATPFEGPVKMFITAYFSMPKTITRKRMAAIVAGADLPTKKPDSDNIAKIVCDALNKFAYADDAQAADCFVMKRWTSGTPRTEIVVRHFLDGEARNDI
jgi:Holliday junction resolvase RusA-like endonuclease